LTGEKDLVVLLRGIIDSYKESDGLNLIASYYHPWTGFADQFIMIRGQAVQMVVMASSVVMATSIILIPNFMCSLAILFSIVSIQIGVLGFVSLWNVSLDIISIINLLMCIGTLKKSFLIKSFIFFYF